MAIRDLDTIISDAVTFIQSKIPSLSLLTGTVARDVVIESPSQEFAGTYIELDRVQRQQTLNDDTAFEDDELTNLASSFGIDRILGVSATGTIVFRLPSFTIADGDIIIPAGTEVATATSATNPVSVSFTTDVSRTFVAASAASFFNPVTSFFEITAPITAVQTGIGGNVSVGTIVTIVSSVSGALQVANNLPTSNGSDAETNESLLARVRTKLVGNNVGTPDGLISLVDANSSIIDSLLIRPGDLELTRDEFGNAADVIIIGETLVEVSEARVFTSGTLTYITARQPVISVNSTIGGLVGATPFTFTESVDYVVEFDTTSLTRGTVRATSQIRFLGGTLPDAGSTFTIVYSVNTLVEDLQADLDSDANKIIGSDNLIREAVKVLIRIGATITVLPGFVKADVAAAATTNVANLLNSIGLDTDVDQSDIIATIQNTTGVDSVGVPLDSIEVKRPTDIGFITVSDIDIARTEFGRVDDTSPNPILIV